ncbi:hypothetical protein ACIOWE_10530 [Pseudomonas sp. NPDC087598]|uniref:hypothetical protein n=1 Tax=Pseudomonas sp. NPDC087598 TaxID=3364440 RepID=UPI00381CF381
MGLKRLEDAHAFVVADDIVCIYWARVDLAIIENAKPVDSITPEQNLFLKGLTFGPINR